MRVLVALICVAVAGAMACGGCGGIVADPTDATPRPADAAQSCPMPAASPAASVLVFCPTTPPPHGSPCAGLTGTCGWFADGCGYVLGSCAAGAWHITSPCGETGPDIPPGA